MYPVAIVMMFALLLLAGIGAMTETIAVRASTQQQALRYAQALVGPAEDALAAQTAQALVAGSPAPATLPSAAPVAVCTADAQGHPCTYTGTYTGTLEGGTAGGAAGAVPTGSNNVDTTYEAREAGQVTVRIANGNGTTVVTRTTDFSFRVVPTAPYFSIVNASAGLAPMLTTGNVGTDGDPSGCAGANPSTTVPVITGATPPPADQTCGQNTMVQTYSGCDDTAALAAPNTTAQTWENAMCQEGTAPAVSAAPSTSWNEFPNSAYADATWANGNTETSGGWAP